MAGPRATDLCSTVGTAWSQRVLGLSDTALGLAGVLEPLGFLHRALLVLECVHRPGKVLVASGMARFF